MPINVFFILDSRAIHPSYRIPWWRRLALGWKMFINTTKIPTATPYQAHLVMALKLLEMSPDVPGDVVECGSYRGGSTANLSLICQIVGRRLRVYDSFAGLPETTPLEQQRFAYYPGDYKVDLSEVQNTVQRYGAIDCCQFIKGWFKDTLPRLSTPVVLAFADVDIKSSLHDCVKNIWPHLVEGGYIFIDECHRIDYVSLFYSERWWRTYLNATPPGLIGAGTGLPLGKYYIGPDTELSSHPRQKPSTAAYARKGISSLWDYYPEESAQ
ncbi:hypothetical protein A2V68_00140 [candidate division Kazan bacterium RBG_13_50_9]|uniref:Macrocin O-methyltransferase n=1 Tax=candidate division Kazan bacterium RBG_13_50_9 TaxID=1798535 RepID=A0A1F4NRX5_UNCK3|nr:MAG: hypothetical protein A2V68_00140 [candidate division Kazan bacterium RBG_13_50_9]